MEKLKEGDRVVLRVHHWRSADTKFIFTEVERVTKTLAILKNGDRLVNEPSIGHYSKRTEFRQYGDSNVYYLETEQDIKDDKAEKERIEIGYWFFKRSKTFTDKEKKVIYDIFKECGILDEPSE